jgi:hypothetical protein
MATMYENVCGNCVGRVEMIFLLQFIVAKFLKLSNQYVMISKNQMHAYENLCGNCVDEVELSFV